MGVINFGFVAFWVLSPVWFSRKMVLRNFCQVFRWSRTLTLHRIPWYLPYSWGKSRKILSQGNQNALGQLAPHEIRLVDFAIAGDGLTLPAGSCRPCLSRQATGWTLGQRICRVSVLGCSPDQLTLTQSSQSGL